MGLYDNAWSTTYEEIKRFYPVWYRDVLEMDAIWRVQGRELDGVRATVEGLIDNGYILTADLPTITSLEDFLRIVPEPGQSLDERRQVVAAYVRGREHIGAPEIRSIIGTFTAGTVDVSFHTGVVYIKIRHNPAEPLNMNACKKIMLARIPTHLNILFIDEIVNPENLLISMGGAMAAITRIPIPEAADDFRLEGAVRIGGQMALIHTLPLPEIP